MKRRLFLQRSSLGLSALLAGAGALRPLFGAAGGRVYGIPDSVRPRTALENDLLRLSLARTDIPPEAWQDVAALSQLAQDVFDNPGVAAVFTRDPAGYLKTAGLPDVVLDPASIEVKIALALGDPEVRASLAADDPRGFVRALEARGLLESPEPSQLARRLEAQLAAVRPTLEGEYAPEACTLIVVCAVSVWVLVVLNVAVAVAVAVAVTVYAYVYVSSSVSGRRRKAGALLESRPSFRLAGALGGRNFQDRVADAFVEDNVERVAQAVEGLESWRRAGVMDGGRLRGLVRTQMLRQLQGHVPFETAQA
jgi:hypothetical protein